MKRKTLVLWSILIFSIANFADIALLFGQSESYKDLNMSLFQNYSVIYFINLLIYLIVIFAFIFESFSSEVILKLKYFFPFWITVSLLIDKIGKIPISFQMISVKDDIELFSFFNTFISILSLTTIIIGIFLNKKIPISNLNSGKNKIE